MFLWCRYANIVASPQEVGFNFCDYFQSILTLPSILISFNVLTTFFGKFEYLQHQYHSPGPPFQHAYSVYTSMLIVYPPPDEAAKRFTISVIIRCKIPCYISIFHSFCSTNGFCNLVLIRFPYYLFCSFFHTLFDHFLSHYELLPPLESNPYCHKVMLT